jgi:peptidoglycan/xylan/chitin deacetylase (PgdA/CDA1 family)
MKPEFYIFCYHIIGNAPSNTRNPSLFVSKKEFNKHLSKLKKNGFTFITLSEFEKIYSSLYRDRFIEHPQPNQIMINPKIYQKFSSYEYLPDKFKSFFIKKKVFKKCVYKKNNRNRYAIITFDDGSESVYKNAFEVLMANEAKATIFIVSDLINGFDEWNAKNGGGSERLLTFNQIKEMVTYGIELGSHSMTHPSLIEIPLEKVYNEITISKRTIESLFNINVNFFAYPYGHFNSTVKEVVKKAGFLGACSTKPGIVKNNQDFFELNRVGMSNSYSFRLKRLLFNINVKI